ncbi:MAG: quinate 5-dehydrogenase [Chthonomonadales bacterium]|nr:quinate 5-dehydrogenase [Chthonomonadales bacterium]
MKRVVSVSLGTSSRDKSAQATFLDTPFTLERIGTDGDRARFRATVAELDGKVDCFGVGGTDAFLYAGDRRYAFRQTLDLMRGARVSPWVDGSGLKHTLERETVGYLHDSGLVDFSTKRVLLVSAVDRFGMAEALVGRARSIVFGDLLFGLGLPIPLRSWPTVKALARLVLPVVTRLPVEWIYPTGAKQEVNTPRFPRVFREADVIAGDWHIIRRFMPDRLDGKIILTQSSRAAEVELLRRRGAELLITTTPEIGGESFATNVMEGVLVVLLGRPPAELTPTDYVGTLKRLGWRPTLTWLQRAPAAQGEAPRADPT